MGGCLKQSLSRECKCRWGCRSFANIDLFKHPFISPRCLRQCNTFVETLDLSDNGLPPDSWPFIAEVISENYYVTTLHLAGNGLGARVGKVVKSGNGGGGVSRALLANRFDQNLVSAVNQAPAIATLASALAENRFLVNLDLSRNELDDDAGPHIEK